MKYIKSFESVSESDTELKQKFFDKFIDQIIESDHNNFCVELDKMHNFSDNIIDIILRENSNVFLYKHKLISNDPFFNVGMWETPGDQNEKRLIIIESNSSSFSRRNFKHMVHFLNRNKDKNLKYLILYSKGGILYQEEYISRVENLKTFDLTKDSQFGIMKNINERKSITMISPFLDKIMKSDNIFQINLNTFEFLGMIEDYADDNNIDFTLYDTKYKYSGLGESDFDLKDIIENELDLDKINIIVIDELLSFIPNDKKKIFDAINGNKDKIKFILTDRYIYHLHGHIDNIKNIEIPKNQFDVMKNINENSENF